MKTAMEKDKRMRHLVSKINKREMEGRFIEERKRVDVDKIHKIMLDMANVVTHGPDIHEAMYAAALLIACSLDQSCKTFNDKIDKLELMNHFIINSLNDVK